MGIIRRILLLITFNLLLFILTATKGVYAQALINEFSVQPSDKYDWVELYSPTDIDISGWTLSDNSGIFETFPEGTQLTAGNYEVVTQYQRLDNDGDSIFLKDEAGELKDGRCGD